MEKRTKLTLLIIVALILLAIGLWFLLQPFLSQIPAAQPPSLPTNATSGAVTAPTTPTAAAPTPTAAGVKQLEDLASAIASRVGSGSSASGFSGYEDVLINATPDEQARLKAEQA